jgi:hypothetical protein
LVLAAISDDYEEPNHIYQNVARRATACGVPATRGLVELLLLELVEQQLAKAYDLLTDPEGEFEGVPKLADIGKYYFLITQEGLAALLAAREAEPWPFDEEDELVPGWIPLKD